jgi:putative phosphoribosyl transferase
LKSRERWRKSHSLPATGSDVISIFTQRPLHSIKKLEPEGENTMPGINPYRQAGQIGRFADRSAAGQQLARQLSAYKDRDDVIVLGLPRGGVAVAYEVARELHAPLDVFVVRKLGVPGYPELAMGAIATGGVWVLNRSVVRNANISEEQITEVATIEQQELNRRENAYRGHAPPLILHNRTVILVDDGLATGATMRAAVKAVRQLQAVRIVVAVPVTPPGACQDLERESVEVVYLLMPRHFRAIGEWYGDFSQMSDDEVRDLLAKAAVAPVDDPSSSAASHAPM